MRLKDLTAPLALAVAMLCTVAVPVVTAETAEGHYIVMLGAPGAGKSTNSEKLVAKHGIPWIEVGELVEEAVAKTNAQNKSASKRQHGPSKIRRSYNSQRSQKTASALKKLQAGELVDDDSLNVLVAAELLSSTASKGFILDGYPMTVQQAAFLDSLLAAKNHGPLDVIYLNVPDDVALKRMKDRGRVDDVKGLGKERLSQFRDNIQLVLDYYGDDVVEIDGTQSKSDVAKAIEQTLAN